MISGGRKGAALPLLKIMYFWELQCTIFSPFSVKVYTYIRFWGLQGGSVPLPIGKLVFPSYLRIISGPLLFGLNLQKYIISGGSLWPPEIYNFWWSQGAAVLFIRECVFLALGNHYLRKLSCKLNTHNFRSFWSKFTEIYNFWWLRGGSPSFHKRMCISGEP